MIRGVVFDLDHTLSDRYGTIREIAKHLGERFVLAPGVTAERAAATWIDLDRRFVHLGFAKVYGDFAASGVFAAPFPTVDALVAFHGEWFSQIAVPLPFTLPLLGTLRARGLRLGLITNGSSAVQRAKIRLLGLETAFDEILVGGEFGPQKPNPPIFAEMSRRLGIPPAELLFVGDNPKNDIEGSRNAGYTPVWVRTTGTWVYPEIPKPRYAVDTVAELADFDFDNLCPAP